MAKVFEACEVKYCIDSGSMGGILIKIAYLTFDWLTFQIKCFIIKLTEMVDAMKK